MKDSNEEKLHWRILFSVLDPSVAGEVCAACQREPDNGTFLCQRGMQESALRKHS